MPTDLPALSRRVAVEVLAHGAQSRAQLAKRMGLSPATVTRIVRPLIDTGLLVEEKAVRTPGRGRSSLPLDVVADDYRFVGVKVAGDSAHGVVTDLHAEVLDGETAAVPSSEVADVVGAVVALVERLRVRADRTMHGIGVTVGGLVSSGEIVADSPFLHGHAVPFRSLLAAEIDVPLYLANDVVGLTRAQQWFGYGRAWSDFAVLTVGAGVGYGLVIDDEVKPTPVTPVSHFPVDPHGPLCPDGHRGCMTAYATSAAISAAVSLAHGEQVSYDEVLRRARDGDPVATRVVGEAAYALGRAAAAVTSLTGVERIVLSGEGVAVAELAPSALRAGRQAYGGAPTDLEPVIRPMSSHEWARGAAVIAIQEVFP